MKLKTICMRSAAVAVAAVCFSSCAVSTPASRAAKYPQMADALTPTQRESVMRGHITEGMSKDAVYLAWGAPSRVTRGSEGGRDFEQWRYTELRPIYSSRVGIGFGYGYGYGGYGGYRGRYGRHGGYYPGYTMIDYGPDYVPVTSAVVKFRSGRVSGWEEGR